MGIVRKSLVIRKFLREADIGNPPKK